MKLTHVTSATGRGIDSFKKMFPRVTIFNREETCAEI